MPIINIKTAMPEPTKEQKEQLISEITDVVVKVLGKQRERVVITLETFDLSSVGFGGKTIENIKKETK